MSANQETIDRLEKLRKEISYHRTLVHVYDREEISEAALDSLKHELVEIETAHPELITADSPSQRIAGKPLDGFTKVQHKERMLSLNDVFSHEEVQAWEDRIRKLLGSATPTYYAEVKLDGFAISLTYQQGMLFQAATRGDGTLGEDVTQNARTIDSIPLSLALAEGTTQRIATLAADALRGRFEVRGEVYISRKNFELLNQEQTIKGEPLFANPRNLGAGSMRQLDPHLTAARRLSFFAYGVSTEHGQTTHEEEHLLAKALGLPVEPHSRHCMSLEDVTSFLSEVEKDRPDYAYNTDGAVVNVNENELFEQLGVVGKAPRAAVAYKFSAEQTTTVIKDIELRIGRTGAVTPVAILDPVKLAGTTVQRATLHNEDEIVRKDIRIGDTVIVQKAGDIIPEVVQVLERLRPKNAKPYRYPAALLGAPLTRRDGEAAHYVDTKALNTDGSDSQVVVDELLKRRLEHYAARGCMDIAGLGEKVVSRLVEADLVSSYADLYTLTADQLLTVEGFADLSGRNLIEGIMQSRNRPLSKLLFGLGIRHVGSETAVVLSQFLANHFADRVGDVPFAETLEVLKNMTQVNFEALPDVGPVVSESLFSFFTDPVELKELDRLVDLGMFAPLAIIPKATEGPFLGKTVVLTGTLDGFTREEAGDLVRRAGGKTSSSVSAETDFVLAGDKAGSKLAKAEQLGVKILNEAEFRQIISELLQ